MAQLAPLSYQRFAYDGAGGAWEWLAAAPPPDLAGVVESFWISRGQVTFLHERILPQNNVELMFNLRQPFGVPNRAPAHRRYQRAWVAGMQREWLIVTPQYDPSQPTYLLSIRMPPLGAYRLLGLPLAHIAEDVHELEEVLGSAIRRIHERLGQEADPGMQFAVLCDFARQRVASSRVTLHGDATRAVQLLANSTGAERIESICKGLQISRKHLRCLFAAHVGLSPKLYARMFRFRSIVDLIQAGRELDWSQAAVSCGYYDQAHFNREFREFSGMSPSDFARSGSVDGLSVVVG